jgi:hypothetical protein
MLLERMQLNAEYAGPQETGIEPWDVWIQA